MLFKRLAEGVNICKACLLGDFRQRHSLGTDLGGGPVEPCFDEILVRADAVNGPEQAIEVIGRQLAFAGHLGHVYGVGKLGFDEFFAYIDPLPEVFSSARLDGWHGL